MRERKQIDWKTVLTGIVAYEQPFAALDGERFDRIERGFSSHYEVQRVSPDAFAFTRGEGYSRLPRLDAFGYVDRGRVERVRNAETELPDIAANIAVLPAGWRAIRFTLDIRVLLIFWAALLLGLKMFALPEIPIPAWLAGFAAIWALHGWLVMRSLDNKLRSWMARSTWN